jgi:hypothetical protein
MPTASVGMAPNPLQAKWNRSSPKEGREMMTYVFTVMVASIVALVSSPPVIAPAVVSTDILIGCAVKHPEKSSLDKTWTTGVQEKEAGSQVLVFQALASRGSFQTERTGFEPADQFPGHRFSKPALSTTQPPLQRPRMMQRQRSPRPISLFYPLG